MKIVCLAALATTCSAITSNTKVAENKLYYGGIGPVRGFTFPQMGGEDGNHVAMGAYTSDSSFLGVFHTDGTGLVDGLNSSTPTSAGSLQGFGDFAVSAGSPLHGSPCATFVSSAGDVSGVFVQMPNGLIATVATTDTIAPGAGAPFSYFGQPSVEISEDLSTVHVAFAGRAGSSWRGIVLASLPIGGHAEVTMEISADRNSTIPGTDSLFRCLTSPQVTRQGDVIFFGSHCGSNLASKMVQEQFNQLVMFQTQPVLSHALTRHRDAGVSHMNAGLFRSRGGVITAVVDYQSTIPHGNDGEHFVAFSDPGVGLDGTVGFVAMGSNGSYGIYKDMGKGAGLMTVVNNKHSVPGYSKCPFASFPQQPSIDANGQAVFFGECNSEVAGVFYETSSSSEEYGTILTLDDKVADQSTLYVGYSSNAVSGDKAALYIVLNDTTAGVWAFDVPRAQQSVLL